MQNYEIFNVLVSAIHPAKLRVKFVFTTKDNSIHKIFVRNFDAMFIELYLQLQIATLMFLKMSPENCLYHILNPFLNNYKKFRDNKTCQLHVNKPILNVSSNKIFKNTNVWNQ